MFFLFLWNFILHINGIFYFLCSFIWVYFFFLFFYTLIVFFLDNCNISIYPYFSYNHLFLLHFFTICIFFQSIFFSYIFWFFDQSGIYKSIWYENSKFNRLLKLLNFSYSFLIKKFGLEIKHINNDFIEKREDSLIYARCLIF